MKYCKACGDNIPDSVRFCPSCGSAVEEQPLVNIQKEEVAREHHEWKFLTERLAYGIFQVRVHTNVTVEGSRITVDTHRQAVFFKWGRQRDSFDVKEVKKVTLEKKISKLSIFLIVLGIFMLLVGNWWGLLPLGTALLTLYDKYLLIQHRRGGFRIYDAELIGTNGPANEFFDYIQARNPQAMAIIRG